MVIEWLTGDRKNFELEAPFGDFDIKRVLVGNVPFLKNEGIDVIESEVVAENSDQERLHPRARRYWHVDFPYGSEKVVFAWEEGSETINIFKAQENNFIAISCGITWDPMATRPMDRLDSIKVGYNGGRPRKKPKLDFDLFGTPGSRRKGMRVRANLVENRFEICCGDGTEPIIIKFE